MYIATKFLLSLHVQVTRVVLFDWPRGLTDYLHRVGRTGRVGMQEGCLAISFMTRRRDIKMAWTIKVSATINHFVRCIII